MVETGASGSRVSRGLKRVNLCIGEIRRARSGGGKSLGPSRKDVGSRSVGFSNGDVEFTILFDFSFGFDGVSSVEGHDVRVDVDGDNGTSGVGKLLRDKHSGSPVLEQEEHQCVPNDALKDHNLDHQAPRKLTVHSLE